MIYITVNLYNQVVCILPEISCNVHITGLYRLTVTHTHTHTSTRQVATMVSGGMTYNCC